MCLCCVLVSGWSLNEEFGLEFKLSCREQNGLQDKKKIYIYILVARGMKRKKKKSKTCGPSAGKAGVCFSHPPLGVCTSLKKKTTTTTTHV